MDVAICDSEIDVEKAVRLVAGMKGEAKESALTSRKDATCNIEKRRREQLAVLDDSDSSALLDDKESCITRRRRDVSGIRQAGRHFLHHENKVAWRNGRIFWVGRACR